MINYTLAIKWTKGETVSTAGFFPPEKKKKAYSPWGKNGWFFGW